MSLTLSRDVLSRLFFTVGLLLSVLDIFWVPSLLCTKYVKCLCSTIWKNVTLYWIDNTVTITTLHCSFYVHSMDTHWYLPTDFRYSALLLIYWKTFIISTILIIFSDSKFEILFLETNAFFGPCLLILFDQVLSSL